MTWKDRKVCPRCGGKMLNVLCRDCDYERNFFVWSFVKVWPAVMMIIMLAYAAAIILINI